MTVTASTTVVTGATVWLTGLPSAGKSTLARGLSARISARGRRVQVLDGDELRTNLTAGLGFSRADRDENVRRIGYVAELLARNGVLVVVPVIAPYEAARAAVRAHHAEHGSAYLEVHVATPVRICERRDVKGLYAQQRAGTLRGLTGVDDPYELPAEPDLRLDTSHGSPARSIEALVELLESRGLL